MQGVKVRFLPNPNKIFLSIYRTKDKIDYFKMTCILICSDIEIKAFAANNIQKNNVEKTLMFPLWQKA